MKADRKRAFKIIRKLLPGTLMRTGIFLVFSAIPASIVSVLLAGQSTDDTLLWRFCYRDLGELVAVEEQAAIAMDRKPSCVNNARITSQALVLFIWLVLAVSAGVTPLAKAILGKTQKSGEEDWILLGLRLVPGNAFQAVKDGIVLAGLFGLSAWAAINAVAPAAVCPREAALVARVEAVEPMVSVLGEGTAVQMMNSGQAPRLKELLDSVGAVPDSMDWHYNATQEAKRQLHTCTGKAVDAGIAPAIAFACLLMLLCIQKPQPQSNQEAGQ